MSTRTVEVPFDKFMSVIEDYLFSIHMVKDTEFLVYADLGLTVNDNGMIAIEIKTQDLLEFSETNVLSENNVVQLNRI